jgi:hypothetical protein
MTTVGDLKILLDWLEKSAQSNERVRLSGRCHGLLQAVYTAQKAGAQTSRPGADEALFRIVMSPSKDTHENTTAQTSDIAIAKAMFGAAVRLYPDRKISLYEGSRIVQETT